jgi:GNAT superfamily N-acetyltransferase
MAVSPELSWSHAQTTDEEFVLDLMRAFYAEEHLVFHPTATQAAVQVLLQNEDRGRIFLARTDESVVGYLVLTFGFSLEFHGRFVLLDEIYLQPHVRGRGWGRHGLDFARQWARDQGVASLRLEVNRANTAAKAFYLKNGLGDDQRDLLTHWL